MSYIITDDGMVTVATRLKALCLRLIILTVSIQPSPAWDFLPL